MIADGVVDYEPVYAALFALTEAISWGPPGSPELSKFVTRSRRVKLFTDVAPEQQPALFQAEHDEDETPRTGTSGKVVLGATWIIYWNVGADPAAVPTIIANRILGSVRHAMRPTVADDGYYDTRLTLGGLAYSARIDGKIFKDPGDLDNQGLLVVPIKIIMP